MAGWFMTKTVLVTGTSVREDLLRPLVDAGYKIENPTHLLSDVELGEALSKASAYLLGGDEFASGTALSKAKNLKVIAFLGMGYESFIDVRSAKELKIAVTNTPGTLSNAVAELTVGHILASVRKIHFLASEFEAGKAAVEDKQRDVAALRIGIIGLGGIGSRIAEILRKGFGAQVSYYSRSRKKALESGLAIQYEPLEALVQNADVVVVMTPGNDETKGLINASLLAKGKKGQVIVNTARPEVIDPAALAEALSSGQVSYAAFDGFYDEVSEGAAKLKALAPSKVMITPHIGSLTHDARDAMGIKAVRSILNVLKSGRDENQVA